MCQREQHLAATRVERGAAHLGERVVNLCRHDLQGPRNTCLPGGGDSEYDWPSHQAKICPQTFGDHNIAAASQPTFVGDDNLLSNAFANCGKHVEWGRRTIELPPTVVRHHETVSPQRDSQRGILGMKNSLDHQGAFPGCTHALENLPGLRRGRRLSTIEIRHLICRAAWHIRCPVFLSSLRARTGFSLLSCLCFIDLLQVQEISRAVRLG